MRKVAFLMLAKGHSKRLPNKNKILFSGKPLFTWNLLKAIKITKNFYFNSYDESMVNVARSYRAKIIERDKRLLDDNVPSRVLFISSLKKMPKYIDAILSIQPNSPNLDPKLIQQCFSIMSNNNFNELLTCDKNYKIYGSIWGLSRKKIISSSSNIKIRDKNTQNPDCLILDESIDIHTISEFNKAQKIFKKYRKF